MRLSDRANFFMDDTLMNYPAASSGVSKTTTGKTLRPKGRGIHPDGNKFHDI